MLDTDWTNREATDADMRERDQNVFSKAADKFKAWILVRQSNQRARPFIGQRVYQPKPLSCKPKTANAQPSSGNTNLQVAGLVADPFRWPDAFTADRIEAARREWESFREFHGLGEFVDLSEVKSPPPGLKRTKSGFTFDDRGGRRDSPRGYAINVVEGSKHEGCLTLHGKYIYGDYDLYHIVFLAL